MFEGEAHSVQRQPLEGVAPASIDFVTQNWITPLGEVGSNLMLAAGF